MIRNIDHLSKIISNIQNSSDSERNTLQVELIKEISSKKNILGILSSIMNSKYLLGEMASRSYVHGNGFDKITLLSSLEPEYKLRLHVWWPNLHTPLTDIELIHNHRWDFVSKVLCGELTFQLFQASELGDEMHKYMYRPRGKQEHYSLDLVDKTKLECIFDATLHSGSVYKLSNSAFHRVINHRKSVTSTLMLRGPTIQDSAVVFSDTLIEDTSEIPAPPLDTDVLEDRLRNIAHVLQEQL